MIIVACTPPHHVNTAVITHVLFIDDVTPSTLFTQAMLVGFLVVGHEEYI